MNHRFPLAILLLFFVPGISSAFSGALDLFLGSFVGLLPFVIGAGFGAILDLTVVRRVSVLNTFFHEMGHAFTALLFFRGSTDLLSLGMGEGKSIMVEVLEGAW